MNTQVKRVDGWTMLQRSARALLDQVKNAVASICDLGARSEYHRRAVLLQEVVVLGWNDATADENNMIASLVCKRFLKGRNESVMTCCKTASAYNMHIIVNRLPGDFLRCLEKSANVDIEPKIGEPTGNDFGSTIVTILTHFGDKDARVAALTLRELLYIIHGLLVFLLALIISLLNRLFTVCTTDD